MDNSVYITALSLCPGIGQKSICEILNYFKDPYTAWITLPEHFVTLGWTERQRELFLEHCKKVSLNKIEDDLLQNQISVLTINDPSYPPLLKEIYNAPSVIFLRGEIPKSDLYIAMVGSRKPTPYGRVLAEKLSEELAAHNVTIVSGMARGIDTCSHRGALIKGKTIAVLGSGVDVVYPRENSALLKEIIASGAVISELPPGTPPEPGHFPARNRIISGLSQGVLVVEAAQKSGSLITADFALEQGRDVFAVPGPVTNKNSLGCHYLIKNGAKLTADAQDVLEEYGYVFNAVRDMKKDYTILQTAVLELLYHEPIHFEELLLHTKLDIGTLSKVLTELEMSKDIKQLPGHYYVLDKVIMR